MRGLLLARRVRPLPQFAVLTDLAGLGPGPSLLGATLGGMRPVDPPGGVPAQGMPLRRISRLMVDGLRPSSAAMARTVAFSRSRSAMWMRSSSRRYLDTPEAEASTVIGGFGFPVGGECQPLRHLLPVRTLMPTIRQASVLLHELKVCLPLARQTAPLPVPVLPDLEVHRIP